MPKTVQIRDIDDDTYAALATRAAAQGLSVPEYLRREIARLAARPTISDWLDGTRGRRLQSEPIDPVAVLDQIRGE
ncbi:MAG: antitoxin FitA [Actinomycetota bacterium]|nr:antitoxin FitA [Actinomycetota bacterium]